MMINGLVLLQALAGGTEAPAPDVAKVADDLAELKSLSFNDLMQRLAEMSVQLMINIAIAALVFYAGRFIIRKIYRLVSTIFIRRNLEVSLSTFILSLINIVLYFILIVTVIGILGIETTSFLALFASAGVAIGMALSGTLQNFAGGVLILLLKPYKIGDYIEAQGYAGTVKEIQIFFTRITTADNKTILIPNGGLSTGSVNNYSTESHRRVSWTVSISYGDDVNVAREAILAMFAADSRIEAGTPEDDTTVVGAAAAKVSDSGNAAAAEEEKGEEPVAERRHRWYHLFTEGRRKAQASRAQWEHARNADIASKLPAPNYTPKVFVDQLGASSVDLTVRAWVKSSDYWAVYYYYNELFYNELPGKGINFPFPQLDVHVSGGQMENGNN